MSKQGTYLKDETTYRFGGYCKNFYTLQDKTDSEKLGNIDFNREHFILGNGSNVAFSEKDFDGVVIQSKIDFIKHDIKTNVISLGSGTYLPKLSRYLKSKELCDGEFLLGIPGTVGGALSMNAGCYGYEFLNYVKSFEYYDLMNKKIERASIQDINYGYRFADIHNSIILSVDVQFPNGNPEHISSKMKEFTEHRKSTQPSAIYNAGSVFKNGENYFAAKLIEESGLKGYEIDGVRVSEKHSNFFIAEKGAKSSGLYKLVNYVKEVVLSKHNIELTEEIIFVGDFS